MVLFLFASELKCFHKHPHFKKRSTKGCTTFLQYGYILAPLAIFNHTHKLLPGHYIRFSTSEKSFSINKYWDVYDAYNKPKLDIGERKHGNMWKNY
jgi:asparagine synthase (glutamine-hydrolysing)